jgi:very-short-patch-repair endonuclease
LRGKDQKRAERARSLRRALTPAELTLWTHIRDCRLGGFKFARQEPIDRYAPTPPSSASGGRVREGVCRKRRLIIELDGGQHAESLEDKHRDGAPRALGYRVIRIWNNDVIENLDGVLQNLLSELEK